MEGTYDRFESESYPALDCLAEDLRERGYCIIENAFPQEVCETIRSEIRLLARHGRMRVAGIGKGELHREGGEEVRGDHTAWLDPDDLSPSQKPIGAFLDLVRKRINQHLFLGLWEWEGHYAIYSPGSFYLPHLDRFRNDSRRTVSAVLFFNEGWKAADGGMLRLHLEAGALDILPRMGTAVFFLSDQILHEVTETRRERLSFAGWFKVRNPDQRI